MIDLKHLRGLTITQRMTLWSWIITLMTLLLFGLVIIPQERSVLAESLESKARSVAVSLRDVAAGSVVNEDFSSVVDHCREMLKGDPGLDFLVIVKNDGFALINERGGWRVGSLTSREWRPEERRPVGGIGAVPLVGRRAFHYAHPFDYSGVEWGWIHVGLSLDGYDRSVASVYRWTFIVGAVCTALSLGASAYYARRLLKPIVDLHGVVGRVAGGDLSARAKVDRGDELGALAGSVNAMTEALLRRDRILESVRRGAQYFLGAFDWRNVIDEVLAGIGQATDASRVYVFENHRGDDGDLLMSQRYEWVAPGVSRELGNAELQGISYLRAGLAPWLERLEAGELVEGVVSAMPDSQRRILEPQGIRSLLIIPVRVEEGLWGFIGFDDCMRERVWTEAESSSLRAVADMFGSTISRQRARDALVEAKNTLEERVQRRTLQLREQVEEKERALEELADAQRRLMRMSHEAGMAEVATGVLHNVGNVLNSVNVSVNLIRERLERRRAHSLREAVELLRRHAAERETAGGEAVDARTSEIHAFLDRVADYLVNENDTLRAELDSVCRNVDHIKEIVVTQQSFARLGGLVETLEPAELFEEALLIREDSLARRGVTIERRFEALPPISVQKNQVVQILVNLLANAVTAMQSNAEGNRRLVLGLAAAEGGRVRFVVNDNGVGIPAENLNRIFTHGFTTRRDGHGFGLHGGAITAKNLGGSLQVSSEGPGRGATFTLELPLVSPS